MSEQPDPLQRIASLEAMHERGTIKRGHIDEMLAELRRLHVEVETLRAQRDALLEALRRFADTDLTNPIVRDTFGFDVLHARAAIDAARSKT